MMSQPNIQILINHQIQLENNPYQSNFDETPKLTKKGASQQILKTVNTFIPKKRELIKDYKDFKNYKMKVVLN